MPSAREVRSRGIDQSVIDRDVSHDVDRVRELENSAWEVDL